MAVVGIGVIGLVHDVETCSQVCLQHPLLGPGKMAPVVGMRYLASATIVSRLQNRISILGER